MKGKKKKGNNQPQLGDLLTMVLNHTPLKTNMTIAGKSTIFNRKYIDSFMVDLPASHVSIREGI